MFFYKSDYHLFSEEIRLELREYAVRTALFEKHGNEVTGYDGNFITTFESENNKVVDDLIRNCIFPTSTSLFKHSPGQIVNRHVDGLQWSRNTVISIPLTLGKHADTYFWESFNSTEPVVVVTYEDTLPVVLNTTKFHSLINNTINDRLTLQFQFSQPIEQIVTRLKDSTLFKNI
jgi:hypothetical protein